MIEPPIPADEATRLELLAACKIMYTPAEEAFDDVARLAADLCGTEIALITLVDADYQWFKARVGVEQTGTPRDLSFCGHCITGSVAMLVPDTHADPRFADNPLVTGEPYLRFYAGVPLEVAPGSAIGALSVASRTPRTLTDKQLGALWRLAKQVSRELQLRRDLDRVAKVIDEDEIPVGPGSVVSGWRLVREVGRGGVGVVFEARDAGDARVAIKLLLPKWRRHEQLLERFAREARVLMRLTTPHVGKLIDVGNLDVARGGLPFLVLEYLEGRDLERVRRERARERVDWQEAFAWAADACDGLAEAHALGVIHRDLKPSNVFLAECGAPDPIVKVVDFGIAAGDPAGSAPTQRLTSEDTLVGSPPYMAPEQLLSAGIDARTDIWSMGALLYETISGHLPFPGKTQLQTFAAVMTRPPLPMRAHLTDPLPPGVEPVLLRCLQKVPDDRYGSMTELASALRSVSAGRV